MLKAIDLLVGLKILSSKGNWTQMQIANKLKISSSQVNAAVKELLESRLLAPGKKPLPIHAAFEEFIIHGVKYCFPASLGELTIGMPTAYAAPPLSNEIVLGHDPIPVWPYVKGTHKGLGVDPLHPNVPVSLEEYPDPLLHQLLTLIDAIRIGKARERNIAIDKIKKIIEEAAQSTSTNF